jgi:hypothetical protein
MGAQSTSHQPAPTGGNWGEKKNTTYRTKIVQVARTKTVQVTTTYTKGMKVKYFKIEKHKGHQGSK